MFNSIKLYLSLFLFSLFIVSSCSANQPKTVGLKNNNLSVCSGRPNCVSSLNSEPDFMVAPFKLNKAESWDQIKEITVKKTNWKLITSTDNYLHFECSTTFLRFIDDLQLNLKANGIVQLRSASRIGYSDFGANRKRVEKLRRELTSAGIIK